MAISRREFLDRWSTFMIGVPLIGRFVPACAGGINLYVIPIPIKREGTVAETLRRDARLRVIETRLEGRAEPLLVEVEGQSIPIDRGPDVILIRHNGIIFRESLRTRSVKPGDQLLVMIAVYDAGENPRHRETNGRR